MAGQTMSRTRREAMEYLLSCLDDMERMSAYLDAVLGDAAERLVKTAMRYNVPAGEFRFSADPALQAEVRRTIALLKSALVEELKRTLTFIDGDDREHVCPVFSSKDHGKTLKERIALYCGRFAYECEAVIAAALLQGVHDAGTVARAIRTSLRSPWTNPYFLEEKGRGAAVRLRNGGVKYGAGKTACAASGLAAVLDYTVRRGYAEVQIRTARARGAIGWRSFRGSSYPCALCDGKAAEKFHTMDEDLPPFHPHCVCGMEFIYRDSMI